MANNVISANINRIFRRIVARANQNYAELIRDVTYAVSDATPVDSGLLLANWRLHTPESDTIPRLESYTTSPYGGRTRLPNSPQSSEERRAQALGEVYSSINSAIAVVINSPVITSVRFDNETSYALIRETHPAGAFFVPVVNSFAF